MGAQQTRERSPEVGVRPKFFDAHGARRNPARAPLEEMKAVQLEQLEKFRAEIEFTGDPERLPPHRNLAYCYRYFVAAARGLPDLDWMDEYTECQTLCVVMEHINGTYLVHNGREQKKVKVSSKMVGHKFGEFSFTRTKPHGGRSTVEEAEPGAGLGLGLGRG